MQEGVTVAGKRVREHLDSIGHKQAFEYIIEVADKNMHLTEKVIKELHSLVLMNDRENSGKYRSIPVQILGALHTPPPPYLVAAQMEQLVADYNSIKADKHLIEVVADFHLRFEGVHPFIDGNGRAGRLILNLELIKAGLLPVNFKYSDRQRYFACFDSYYGTEQSAEPLIKLIMEYETAELEKRIDMLQ